MLEREITFLVEFKVSFNVGRVEWSKKLDAINIRFLFDFRIDTYFTL